MESLDSSFSLSSPSSSPSSLSFSSSSPSSSFSSSSPSFSSSSSSPSFSTPDEDMNLNLETNIQVPILRRSPRTRSGSRDLREGFNQAVEALLITLTNDPAQAYTHQGPVQISVQDEESAQGNQQGSAPFSLDKEPAQAHKKRVQEESTKVLSLLPSYQGLTIFTINHASEKHP